MDTLGFAATVSSLIWRNNWSTVVAHHEPLLVPLQSLVQWVDQAPSIPETKVSWCARAGPVAPEDSDHRRH